jgi:hypothetical protein
MLSSDKTNITVMTGGHQAHLLLLSLAGLDMHFCMKASNCAFLLIALLPIPKFIHKDQRICSMLEACLMHECLDFLIEPLKIAAWIGVMMSDPAGNLKYCFTPLAAYIVDMPESAMLVGVAEKTLPITMAYYKYFSDPVQHEPPPPLHNFRLLKMLSIYGISITTSRKLPNFASMACIGHSGMTGPWLNHQSSSPLGHYTTGIECSGTMMPSGISRCSVRLR